MYILNYFVNIQYLIISDLSKELWTQSKGAPCSQSWKSRESMIPLLPLCYSQYWLHPQTGSKPTTATPSKISRHDLKQRRKKKVPSHGSLSGKGKISPQVPQHFSFVLVARVRKQAHS